MPKKTSEKNWLSEDLYFSGDAYFAALIEAIEKSGSRVWIETYILGKDAISEEVLQSLRRASARGVDVRLLIDGFGSLSIPTQELQSRLGSGVRIRVYHPLPFTGLFQARRGWLRRLSLMRRLWQGINRRNHRKTCLIDDQVAFVGGMNLSGEPSERLHADAAWRDTAARVQGMSPEPLRPLQEAFLLAWNSAVETWRSAFHWRSAFEGRLRLPLRRIEGTSSELIRLNHTALFRRQWNRELLFRVMNARERVWLTTPYFVPHLTLIRALRFASWSGVDVRILLPRKNDVFFMKWVNRAFYRFLLHAGVRIYEYEPRPLHAKMLGADQWWVVGSMNLNSRSWYHDLEGAVILKKRESIELLSQQFEQDLTQATEILPGSALRLKPLFARILLYFKRYF